MAADQFNKSISSVKFDNCDFGMRLHRTNFNDDSWLIRGPETDINFRRKIHSVGGALF